MRPEIAAVLTRSLAGHRPSRDEVELLFGAHYRSGDWNFSPSSFGPSLE